MEKIEAWGCSHCGMTSRYKASVSRHERNSCRKNPSRAACITCAQFYDDGDDSDGSGHTWRSAGCLLDKDFFYKEKNNNRDCVDHAPITII